VFLSTNHGANWTKADSGLTNQHVRALAVSGGMLFAGTAGGVFRSLDTAAGWTAVNTGLNDTGVQALAVVRGTLFAGTGTGIYLSTDSGSHWILRDSLLTDLDVRAFAAVGDSTIFAGTFGGGVFVSRDTFPSWTAVNPGLKNLNVQSLSATGTMLFAGTRNGAVWARPLSEMARPNRVIRNPFMASSRYEVAIRNNRVLIYTLPKATRLSIRIFDIRGRLVDMIAQTWQSAGTYNAPLPVGNFSSGNYIVDFNAGGYRVERRFAITR
jgi:hypothetical protein